MRDLGVFAKFWRPGAVKTRLAVGLTRHLAARFHRVFTLHLLRRLARSGDRRWLAYWPPGDAARFASSTPAGWRLTPQSAGDLGRRMAAFFQQRFDDGAQRVVLIGSDSPTLPGRLIRDAFDRLRRRDVVLGPAEDGGYYLIGSRDAPPPVFGQMPWSSSRLLAATRRRLGRTRLSVSVLPTWADIDEPADLRQLLQTLNRHAASDEERALWITLRDHGLLRRPEPSDARNRHEQKDLKDLVAGL